MISDYGLLGKLRRLHPFVYVLANKHYLVGAFTFRPCDSREINLYEKFYDCFAKVKATYSSYRDITSASDDVKMLSNILHSILNLSDFASTKENEYAMLDATWELIVNFSEKERGVLDNQINTFVEALAYMSAYDIAKDIQRRKQL